MFRRSILAIYLLIASALADIYMHHPPGSNNRNRERTENRANANRLFNSQNNDKGGYAWRGDPTLAAAPDALTYYSGSVLRIEWTAQHSCGPNENTRCVIIIQYACNDDMPGLRDGYPSIEGGLIDAEAQDNANAQNQNQYFYRAFATNTPGNNKYSGTSTIPLRRNPPTGTNALVPEEFYTRGSLVQNFDAQEGTGGRQWGVEYGLHEGIAYYEHCSTRTRNKGLYVADRNLNGNSARFTRQNEAGTRHGLECPEERDYYPYWSPTPWHDVAALVPDSSYCDHYRENTQNKVSSGWCLNCDATCRNSNNNDDKPNAPITPEKCRKAGGSWVVQPPKGGDIDCRVASFARDNHLGNAVPVDNSGRSKLGGSNIESSSYDWVIPQELENKQCVLRIRYNISTTDYDGMQFAKSPSNGPGIDSDQNCVGQSRACSQNFTANSVPLTHRPYIIMWPDMPRISVALNTQQAARTFQDRSFVFKVAPRPSTIPASATIWNLNVRGKRGNIVQAYPAVEYDFVPSHLEVKRGDYIHWQWSGSDFNVARNPNNGEGWQYSDRFNVLQSGNGGTNFPIHPDSLTADNSLFKDSNMARRFALLDQEKDQFWGCIGFNGFTNEERGDTPLTGEQNQETNARRNCGKLNNAPQRFPQNPSDGLMLVDHKPGTYYYISTRNNNFSNRSQKGAIVVTADFPVLAIVALAAISVVAVAAGWFGMWLWARKFPDGKVAKAWNSCCGRIRCTCQCCRDYNLPCYSDPETHQNMARELAPINNSA